MLLVGISIEFSVNQKQGNGSLLSLVNYNCQTELTILGSLLHIAKMLTGMKSPIRVSFIALYSLVPLRPLFVKRGGAR